MVASCSALASPVASITTARIVTGGSATGESSVSGAVEVRSGRNLIGRSFRIGVAVGTTCCLVSTVNRANVSPVLRGCYRTANPQIRTGHRSRPKWPRQGAVPAKSAWSRRARSSISSTGQSLNDVSSDDSEGRRAAARRSRPSAVGERRLERPSSGSGAALHEPQLLELAHRAAELALVHHERVGEGRDRHALFAHDGREDLVRTGKEPRAESFGVRGQHLAELVDEFAELALEGPHRAGAGLEIRRFGHDRRHYRLADASTGAGSARRRPHRRMRRHLDQSTQRTRLPRRTPSTRRTRRRPTRRHPCPREPRPWRGPLRSPEGARWSSCASAGCSAGR